MQRTDDYETGSEMQSPALVAAALAEFWCACVGSRAQKVRRSRQIASERVHAHSIQGDRAEADVGTLLKSTWENDPCKLRLGMSIPVSPRLEVQKPCCGFRSHEIRDGFYGRIGRSELERLIYIQDR